MPFESSSETFSLRSYERLKLQNLETFYVVFLTQKSVTFIDFKIELDKFMHAHRTAKTTAMSACMFQNLPIDFNTSFS